MIKGFIQFRDGRIPFVIEGYRMELFTNDVLLTDFVEEYNYKNNYILSGQYFGFGFVPQRLTILVERSTGNTCYLSCYLIESVHSKENFDTIGIQSPYLEDIFRFSYNYIDLSRGGFNFAVNIKEIYTIPFRIEANQYEQNIVWVILVVLDYWRILTEKAKLLYH